jgi:hypothetical protein
VSNSSTTSFCIYGVSLEEDEASKMLNRDHPAIKAQIEKWGDGDALELLEYDETGAEFKERVRAALAEYLNGELSMGTYEEAWYNG